MSQPHLHHDKNNKGFCPPKLRHNFKKGKGRGNYYYNHLHYYNPKFRFQNFQPPWTYRRRKRAPPRKALLESQEIESERPPSPFSGTEEYTMKKIQEASDMIKKKLMMPEVADSEETESEREIRADDVNPSENCGVESCETEKNLAKTSSNNKKIDQYNVEEIHDKIMTHITNLNHGRKVNLICATSSGYDVAIQQIQRQKRLELSRVLRDMCSNQSIENCEAINSIIPDIGIKIEDLPLEVIQELSTTLDVNFEESEFSPIKIKTEFMDQSETIIDNLKTSTLFTVNIKSEPTDEAFDLFHDVNNQESNNFMDSRNTGEEECTNGVSDDFSDAKSDSEMKEPVVDSQGSQSNTNSVSLNSSFSTQTDSKQMISNSTQTEEVILKVNENINSLEDAIQVMLEIDKEIDRLTKMRQSIFLELQQKHSKNKADNNNGLIKSPTTNKQKGNSPLKQKNNADNSNGLMKSPTKKKQESTSPSKKKESPEKKEFNVGSSPKRKRSRKIKLKYQKSEEVYEKALEFRDLAEKVLVMKIVEDMLLAACESGNLLFVDTITGSINTILKVSEAAITSLCIWTTLRSNCHIFIGSFENYLREYSYDTKELLRITEVNECIQCMDLAWNVIFIGTSIGSLKRYNLKQSIIEFEEKISDGSILVIRATQEGARRVLLVGSRNCPVTVRDAMSGLHLRTMDNIVSPTVYSLLLENSMVYCGTTSHDILVFSFHDGNLIHKHQATHSKGISCMKIVKNLLFASCYNGSIYVYNVKSRQYVGTIEGPGGVILTMEVLKNLVVVGTMSRKFKSILIPEYILKCN